MPSGRKSKVIEYNLGDDIERLRSQGYSYENVAKIINESRTDVRITKDVVWRYENFGKHQTTDGTEIVDRYSKLINEIIFKINTLDLDNNTKSALKSYIRGLSKGFDRHLKNLARQSPESIERVYYDKMNKLLISLSNYLCSDCRKNIAELADKELRSRDI